MNFMYMAERGGYPQNEMYLSPEDKFFGQKDALGKEKETTGYEGWTAEEWEIEMEWRESLLSKSAAELQLALDDAKKKLVHKSHLDTIQRALEKAIAREV